MANNIRKGLVGLLGGVAVGAAALFGNTSKTDASVINVYDRTSASIGITDLTLESVSGVSEGLDGNDGPYPNPIQTSALEIYTKMDGNRYAWDSHPVNTLGWDFYLGAKDGPLSVDNFLRFQVTDPTDLTSVFAYDTLSPLTKYEIPTDSSVFTINLPNLVNQSAGEYAHWRVDINTANVPEPATGVAFLSLASMAGLGFGARSVSRYLGRRKEE